MQVGFLQRLNMRVMVFRSLFRIDIRVVTEGLPGGELGLAEHGVCLHGHSLNTEFLAQIEPYDSAARDLWRPGDLRSKREQPEPAEVYSS